MVTLRNNRNSRWWHFNLFTLLWFLSKLHPLFMPFIAENINFIDLIIHVCQQCTLLTWKQSRIISLKWLVLKCSNIWWWNQYILHGVSDKREKAKHADLLSALKSLQSQLRQCPLTAKNGCVKHNQIPPVRTLAQKQPP